MPTRPARARKLLKNGKAVVPSGKKAGVHTGRLAIRKSGFFNIKTEHVTVQGISHKHCRILQRNDGYGYHILNSNKERGASSLD